MKDRYLFRAKRIDNGEWAEGYIFDDGFENGRIFVGRLVIEEYHGTACDEWDIIGTDFCEIDPSTICQCTGLKDKNGNLIFEHDIIKCKGIITAVSWNTKYASWVLTRKGWMYHHFFGESQDSEECEVIGNIFDNPELLEQEG